MVRLHQGKRRGGGHHHKQEIKVSITPERINWLLASRYTVVRAWHEFCDVLKKHVYLQSSICRILQNSWPTLVTRSRSYETKTNQETPLDERKLKGLTICPSWSRPRTEFLSSSILSNFFAMDKSSGTIGNVWVRSIDNNGLSVFIFCFNKSCWGYLKECPCS